MPLHESHEDQECNCIDKSAHCYAIHKPLGQGIAHVELGLATGILYLPRPLLLDVPLILGIIWCW